MVQPEPCGDIGQRCCNGACNSGTAACDNGVCREQIADILPAGTLCGLGHTSNFPHPTCGGQSIDWHAPNGGCPSGWTFVQLCDLGGSSGQNFFACMLLSDTRVTAVPQGLLCGYGHTDNLPGTVCGNKLVRNDGCPQGYLPTSYGDLGADSGHGFFGCTAASPIPLTAQNPTVPRGTVCGLSHTCDYSQRHQCGGSQLRWGDASSCPRGYTLFTLGDLGASSGQGQYTCEKQ
jgi:hypothetical protein